MSDNLQMEEIQVSPTKLAWNYKSTTLALESLVQRQGMREVFDFDASLMQSSSLKRETSELNGYGYRFARYSVEGAIRCLRWRRRIQRSATTVRRIKAREPNTPPTIGSIFVPFDTWDTFGIAVLTAELFPKDCVVPPRGSTPY